MKKLLAAGCCILFFQSFSQVTPTNEPVEEKIAGRRVLIKAISAIVNTEGNKKAPAKPIYVPSAESPLY